MKEFDCPKCKQPITNDDLSSDLCDFTSNPMSYYCPHGDCEQEMEVNVEFEARFELVYPVRKSV